MSDLRVSFEFKGQLFDLTLAECYDLQKAMQDGKDRLKTKCPTCRCMIYPFAECGCCVGNVDIDEEDKV